MTSTNTPLSPLERRAALFARTSTPALVGAALILDARPNLTSEERMSLAWTSDELARRCGGIPDDDTFDALLDTGISYVEALLVTFPELAA